MRIFIVLFLVLGSTSALAQSLAGSVGLAVYPGNNQPQAQQEQDDYQCFTWAKGETGFDPMTAREPEQVVSNGAPAAGSGARGAFRGAARGALLGEIIDDDAGKGAAVGAAIGGMRGRSQSAQQGQQQASAQNQQNQSSFAQQENQFKKTMSVCLEGRGYSVR
jgi:hypothetical protein